MMHAAVKESRQDEKQSAIIRAAEELFMQNGYATTSMDAIAEHAGVSKQTIYAHFQNKENLFMGMMEGMCSRYGYPMETIMKSAKESNNPAEALRSLGMNKLRLVALPQALGLFRLVMSEAPRNPELGNIFYEQGPGRSFTVLGDILTEFTRKSLLNVPDPEHAAQLFFTMIYHPLHFKLMIGIEADTSEDALSAHVDEVVTRFLKAYAV